MADEQLAEIKQLYFKTTPKTIERDFDRAQEIYASFFGGDTTPLTGGTPEDE